MRYCLIICLSLLLTSCISERQFARDSWPFGNPNAPPAYSETAERALGRVAVVTPIPPQAGDVWPGPVQPVPTLGQLQENMTLPLGTGYTPSLPSPYPPGEDPDKAAPGANVPVGAGPLYSSPLGVVPATPGDAR